MTHPNDPEPPIRSAAPCPVCQRFACECFDSRCPHCSRLADYCQCGGWDLVDEIMRHLGDTRAGRFATMQDFKRALIAHMNRRES